MKILILNRGSSSVKCCLYDFSKLPDRSEDPLWEKKIEWKNFSKEGTLKILEDLHSLFSGKEIDVYDHRLTSMKSLPRLFR